MTQKYLSLAGGIRVTIKPQSTSAGATTYSLSNLHGDTMATVNADGTPTIITPTGPFGEQLANHTAPTNATPGTSNDYLGTHAKATETDYLTRPIQMGARVYIPELGRFMQMDPVEGGTLNDYVYAQDPVNQTDTTGEFLANLIRIAVVALFKLVPKQAVKQTAKKATKAVVKQEVKTIAKQVTRQEIKNIASTTPKQMSYNAQKTVDFLKNNDFKFSAQFTKGGGQWLNDGRAGSQLLPKEYLGKPINYTEWDVQPMLQNGLRGSERIIRGSDGSIWHTADHYKTIIRIE